MKRETRVGGDPLARVIAAGVAAAQPRKKKPEPRMTENPCTRFVDWVRCEAVHFGRLMHAARLVTFCVDVLDMSEHLDAGVVLSFVDADTRHFSTDNPAYSYARKELEKAAREWERISDERTTDLPPKKWTRK